MSPVFSQFVFVFLSSIRLSRSSIHLWPSTGSWLSLLERFPLIVPLFVRKCIRHAQKAVRWHGLHIKTFLQYQGKNTHTYMHTGIWLLMQRVMLHYILTVHFNVALALFKINVLFLYSFFSFLSQKSICYQAKICL